MKKFFIYVLVAVFYVGCMTSCDSDDPVVPGEKLVEKSYTSAEGLDLKLNDQPLVGKTITFTPGTGDNATITLEGEKFDINSIIGGVAPTTRENANTGLMIPTAGVIPGSPVVNIPIKLTGSGEECTFEGSYETEYCTFNYFGSINAETVHFDISDLKLKNTSLCGTWKVPTFDTYEWSGVMPAFVNWQSNRGIDMGFGGDETPIGGIISMALLSGLLDDPFNEDGVISITDILPQVLKEVEFKEDGNIKAKYVDVESGNFEEQISPDGVAQYVVNGEGKMLLFLNPQQIAAVVVKTATKAFGTRAEADLPTIIEGVLTNLLPMFQNGIPLEFKRTADPFYPDSLYEEPTRGFMLGTSTLLPIVKAFVPLFEDPEFIKGLVEKAKEDPDMAMMAGMLEPILKSLPAIINETTVLEIGINLTK